MCVIDFDYKKNIYAEVIINKIYLRFIYLMFRTFALSAILAIASAQDESAAEEAVAAAVADLAWTYEYAYDESAGCPEDAWDSYWGECYYLCDDDWNCDSTADHWTKGCDSGNYECDDWGWCYC